MRNLITFQQIMKHRTTVYWYSSLPGQLKEYWVIMLVMKLSCVRSEGMPYILGLSDKVKFSSYPDFVLIWHGTSACRFGN